MNQATTITGDEILTARQALNWSRRQLGDALGLTVSQIARCENSGPKPEEVEHFHELLRKAGVRSEADRDDTPKAQELKPREGRQTHWRGLRPGDVIKVKGGMHSGERMKFGYFQDVSPIDRVPYVGAFNLRNGGEHAIPVEYVRNQRGKALPE